MSKTALTKLAKALDIAIPETMEELIIAILVAETK